MHGRGFLALLAKRRHEEKPMQCRAQGAVPLAWLVVPRARLAPGRDAKPAPIAMPAQRGRTYPRRYVCVFRPN